MSMGLVPCVYVGCWSSSDVSFASPAQAVTTAPSPALPEMARCVTCETSR